MDAALPRHVLLEKRIHHAVASGLVLGFEGLGRDHQAKVRLLGCGSGHGLVVGVKVRVVVDLKTRWLEFLGKLVLVRAISSLPCRAPLLCTRRSPGSTVNATAYLDANSVFNGCLGSHGGE